MNLHSTKFKIIANTILCVLLVGVISNWLLYNYFNNIIIEKAKKMDQLNLDTVNNQIRQHISDVFNLGMLCANDDSISYASKYTSIETIPSKEAALRAQEKLTLYLRSSAAERYAAKIAVFNNSGLLLQSSTHYSGTLSDFNLITTSSAFISFTNASNNQPFIICLSQSIVHPNQQALVFISNVSGPGAKKNNAYIYAEFDIEILKDVLEPFSDLQNIFISSASGKNILTFGNHPIPFDADLSKVKNGDHILYNGQNYLINLVPFEDADLVLCTYSNITALSRTDGNMLYTVIVVVITCILISIAIAIILSNYITRPINRLIFRIRRISNNDFSYDPSIEQSQDEIGQIGRVVNKMAMNIDQLISETKSMYEKQKNIEISLLQSQVNPHFLYNTLDSLYWMAIIQKNTGVANMTRSLVNLLRNIAKGTQDKITLGEEIQLLEDYIAIQSVRYVEVFEFLNEVPEALLENKIIKLTLQPLVENAIFHGIEPTGKYGIIKLKAREEDGDVLITVEDNGSGMTQEQCDSLLTDTSSKNNSSLNGIGVSNVHTRLQLTYGNGYGLSVVSEKDKYTCVTVRIPKEV
ncbi:sensor histidine kinase [Clostridium sp. YIM B02515]|uniref:Sensor histidine kinase n=1 Tax=Clostridium rhizosphaerae TaxID=2803861 RepID=A0ABS1TEY4_9CLOT|nr:sensor histidine kinase [Clostridium rhizosphaerae]MBL4937161.1 sensor histidine kinase [Clostridium rhizosphaerae]